MVAPPPTPKLIWLDQLRRTNTLTLLGGQGVKGGQEPEISPPPICPSPVTSEQNPISLGIRKRGKVALHFFFNIYIYIYEMTP